MKKLTANVGLDDNNGSVCYECATEVIRVYQNILINTSCVYTYNIKQNSTFKYFYGISEILPKSKMVTLYKQTTLLPIT